MSLVDAIPASSNVGVVRGNVRMRCWRIGPTTPRRRFVNPCVQRRVTPRIASGTRQAVGSASIATFVKRPSTALQIKERLRVRYEKRDTSISVPHHWVSAPCWRRSYGFVRVLR